MIARPAFLSYQSTDLDAYFALAPGEEETRRRFEQLAIETYDHTGGKGRYAPFRPYPSAYNRVGADAITANLRERWQDWESEYAQLLERQPALELRAALHTISESHSASSWPYGYEEAIRDWVDTGERAAIPFDDRRDVATPEFYERLRHLRSKIGGWLYWDDTRKHVIHATDEHWERIKAECQPP